MSEEIKYALWKPDKEDGYIFLCPDCYGYVISGKCYYCGAKLELVLGKEGCKTRKKEHYKAFE